MKNFSTVLLDTGGGGGGGHFQHVCPRIETPFYDFAKPREITLENSGFIDLSLHERSRARTRKLRSTVFHRVQMESLMKRFKRSRIFSAQGSSHYTVNHIYI